jgi:mono/diheme cytochrome c family protein
MKTEVYSIRCISKEKCMLFILTLLAFNLIFLKAYAQHKPWITPQIAKNVKNPIAGSASGLSDGQTLYIVNCTPCHGNKGKGDGPASAALNPKPADHSSALIQGETDGSLYWKLSEGRNPMPSYKKILTDKQRWELVNYIRTLSKTPKK